VSGWFGPDKPKIVFFSNVQNEFKTLFRQVVQEDIIMLEIKLEDVVDLVKLR
jgi:hypothetical protein